MKQVSETNIASGITVPLTNMGVLKVSGIDAKKLLQGQLTCHMDEISENESCLAVHCNPQGRIVGLFYLVYCREAYYFLMPRSMITLIMVVLKKYAAFYKVELADVSDDFSIIGGVNVDLPESASRMLIKIPSKKNRYLCVSDITHSKIIRNQFASSDILSINDWHLLDIVDGIPNIYPETSAKILPHEINLIQLNAVSFDKGCYTGQEIIARMHYRGKLKKRLYLARINCSEIAPLPGLDIYRCGSHGILTVGMMIDACPKKQGNYITLIILNESDVKDIYLLLSKDQHTYFYDIKLMS